MADIFLAIIGAGAATLLWTAVIYVIVTVYKDLKK